MATNTYTAIRTTNVTSSVSSVNFDLTGITTGYRDLVLQASIKVTTAPQTLTVRFNNEDGSTGTYSNTILRTNGSALSSARQTNAGQFILSNFGTPSTTTYGLYTAHIIDYANTSKYKTTFVRSNQASAGLDAIVSLWRNTSAITSIQVYIDGGSIVAGSTLTLYGIKPWEAETTPKATGGYVYSDSTYYYHAFPFSGTFTPSQSLTCDYLVVAGGGGSGGGNQAGGGGAGGLRSTVTATGGGGTLESALSLSATPYTVTIGAGGAAGSGGYPNSTKGSNGGNTTFSTITSTGGGGGAVGDNSAPDQNGLTGGSGGGAGNDASSGGGTPGSGTANQGYAGGYGWFDSRRHSGGGGGAGGAGGGLASNSPNGGNGGAGVTITALATPTQTGVSGAYAGGGAGYGELWGTATAGGGNFNTPGTANTGGGGSGGYNNSGSIGNPGGSGLVIIRYAK